MQIDNAYQRGERRPKGREKNLCLNFPWLALEEEFLFHYYLTIFMRKSAVLYGMCCSSYNAGLVILNCFADITPTGIAKEGKWKGRFHVLRSHLPPTTGRLAFPWSNGLTGGWAWACVPAQSLQSCLTLCDPVDCSPLGSSVLGILQARVLQWVAMLSSRGSSRPRDWTHVSYVSCIGRQVLYH